MPSPAGALERLAAHSAEGFPNLLAARARTARRLEEMRARCGTIALPDDAAKDFRPPRFLLNDLVRYWRTICVDFVGKQREDEEKWGLRNAKLRTGRKVLFAAGLLPILLCDRHRRADMRAFLIAQLQAPATDRLAAAFAAYDLMDGGGRALDAYDRWIGMIGDDATRAELAAVRRDSVDASDAFAQVRRAGRDLEGGAAGTALRDPARRPRARVRGVLTACGREQFTSVHP